MHEYNMSLIFTSGGCYMLRKVTVATPEEAATVGRQRFLDAKFKDPLGGDPRVIIMTWEEDGLYRSANFPYVEGLSLKASPHINIEGAEVSDVVFSHEHPDIQTVNITKLLAAIKDGRVYSRSGPVTFSKESMERGSAERDIDPERVAFLEDKANEDKLYEPILCVLLEDMQVIPIDGTHRCAVFTKRGVYRVGVTMIHVSALGPYRVRTFINGKEEKLSGDEIRRGYEFNRGQDRQGKAG